MVALRKHIPARMTVDEFLVWDSGDRSGRLWQLVDGEPVAMAPASQNHGALQTEIARRIANHLIANRPGCRAITNPGIVPNARSTTNARIPDIGVTCGPRSDAHMMPNPVLLIEILSPSNEAETWRNVWSYTTIPSMIEILIVRGTRIEAELLRRQPDGHWPKDTTPLGKDASVTLESIGLTVALADFYATTSLTEAAA